mgnify:CR=1 FL=1
MRMDPLTAAHEIGYFYNNIRGIFNDERVSQEIEKERIIKELREERKRVQPIYNAKGQIIEYDKSGGRHLEVFT